MNRLSKLVTIGLLSLSLMCIGFVPSVIGQAQPEYGGSLVVALTSDPGHLNPAISTATTLGPPTGAIYEGLTRLDFNLNCYGVLAQSWTISPDGKNYTFNLRKNVTWHDGVPFTSADVKFTYEELLMKYHPSSSVNLPKYVESIETPDNYTVVFNLNRSFAPFMLFTGDTATVGKIFPKHIWEGVNVYNDTHNQHPIGTGPFKFDSWIKDDYIRVVKYENYWNTTRPYLDSITFKIITTNSARVMALEAGEVDVLPNGATPFADIAELQKNPDIIVPTKPTGYEAGLACMKLAINHRRPITGNKLVREAFAYAINKTRYVEYIYMGLGKEGSAGGFHHLDWAYNPNVTDYAYDPEKAELLLDAAGYPRGSDGTRFTINAYYDRSYGDLSKVAEVLREDFSTVGITLDLKGLDVATVIQTAMVNWDFDLCITTLAAGPDPELGLARWYVSRNIVRGAYRNFGGYNSSVVDTLFDLAATELNRSKRAEYYGEAQLQIAADVADITFASYSPLLACSKDVVGLPETPHDTYTCSYGGVWLTTAATITPAAFPWTEVAIAAVAVVVVATAGLAYYRRSRRARK